MVRAWESLQNESSLISRGLEEARGILDFNNEVSKVSLDVFVQLPDLNVLSRWKPGSVRRSCW